MIPKLVITDIDGVWTDGGMYYDEKGNEWKKFNTSDSAGVLFLHLLEIPVAIMTGEQSQAVQARANKLNIDFVFLGAKNKVQLATELCDQLAIDMKDVAFIGDDLNDIRLIQRVGLSGAPSSAPSYVKKHADIITEKEGGAGAFREFVESILSYENQLETALEKYFEQPEFNQ